MLLLATLFIVSIIAIAFFINSALDKRDVKRLEKDAKDGRET